MPQFQVRVLTSAAAWTAGALAALVLGACTEHQPEAAAPPPIVAPPLPATSPDLMGGPPNAAPPPARADSPAAEMAPIANPEDMTPDERERVYGHRYDSRGRRQHGRRGQPTEYSAPEAAVVAPSDAVSAQTAPIRHRRGLHHLLKPGHHRPVRQSGAPTASMPPTGHTQHAAQSPQINRAAAPPPTVGSADQAAPSAPPPTSSAAMTRGAAAPAASTASTEPPDTTSAAPGGPPNLDWLGVAGTGSVNVPGLGRIPSRYVTAAMLVLLALVVMLIAASRSRAARLARRRAPVNTIGSGPRFADERERHMRQPRS